MGNVNFDNNLKMMKGREQYYRDKSKAGRSGSSAGKPRPYARANMKYARLYSPLLVGQTVFLTPKKPLAGFVLGRLYEWRVIEPGVGLIGGSEFSADEIKDLFKVIPKGKYV